MEVEVRVGLLHIEVNEVFLFLAGRSMSLLGPQRSAIVFCWLEDGTVKE